MSDILFTKESFFMGKTEKKINKLLIGAIIGSALIGVGGLSMTPKGKSFLRRMFGKSRKRTRFVVRGIREMKRQFSGKPISKKKKRGIKKKRTKRSVSPSTEK